MTAHCERLTSLTVVERVTIPMRRLPQDFDGMTVAVIADLHAGARRGGVPGLKRVVEDVNALHPDIIVLLGDMVHRARQASRYLPLLSELKATAGVWATLGNHEHETMWYSRHFRTAPPPSLDEWRRLYAEIGVELLVNEARPLEKRGSRIWLVGVDDAYSKCDDLPAALQGVDQTDFCLVITHFPDLIDDPRIAEVDLILAGHTHGGQVHLPFFGPLYTACRKPRQRAAGLVEENGTIMYVSRGVGEALPIRFRCPRQIPLISLRREG